MASIAELLAQARSRLIRLSPHDALTAQHNGAVIVDLRASRDRADEGAIPGAMVIARSVLEWRLDPSSEWCDPIASYDLFPILICNDGFSSSLAAATLHDIGITRATDVDGGFRAWAASGLPVTADPQLHEITVDCADPQLLAQFWSQFLGGEVVEPLPGWTRLLGDGIRPDMTFQPVPEPKVGKTRIHVDIRVADIEAATDRVIDLGGQSLGQRYDYDEGTVMTMADPAGNEFCIVQYTA